MGVKILTPYDDNVEVEVRMRGMSFSAALDTFYAEHEFALPELFDSLQILSSNSFDIDDLGHVHYATT